MVSSLAGEDPWEKHEVYGISKAGINNMTKFLSKELLDDNIRVNSVVPGTVDTLIAQRFIKGNPIFTEKNTGKPQQIASVIATICSEDGSFMNGELYRVHGGFAKL